MLDTVPTWQVKPFHRRKRAGTKPPWGDACWQGEQNGQSKARAPPHGNDRRSRHDVVPPRARGQLPQRSQRKPANEEHPASAQRGIDRCVHHYDRFLSRAFVSFAPFLHPCNGATANTKDTRRREVKTDIVVNVMFRILHLPIHPPSTRQTATSCHAVCRILSHGPFLVIFVDIRMSTK